MKLTILHLVPTFEGGGAERQLSMLAVEQSRRGTAVHIGCRRGGVNSTVLRASGVNVHALGDHRGPSPRLLINIHALLRTLEPDIVQTWLPQMDVLGGTACLWRATPWVLSERASELAFSKTSALLRLRRWLTRYASAIVANSAAGAGYWRAAVPGDRLIDVVRNAVDASAIRGTPPNREALAGNAGQLLLVVGRLHHQKAVEIVLQAVARLARAPEFRVLILGDGPQRATLEGMIRASHLEDRVVMRPYQRDWWGLLKIASALVSVSRYEGHPNVVLEAMAAECPLIVSDIPEHREFLDESSAMLVPTEDATALARAIDEVLRDGRAARVRAKMACNRLSDLTVEAVTDAYERVYEQVLKRQHRQCVA